MATTKRTQKCSKTKTGNKITMVSMDSSDLVMENWLTDENFDFEVTSSPVLLNETSTSKGDKGEDDEEVFFGPPTHKERCIATVVKEQEQLRTPCELKPEEQALLLREAALLGLRIKHGSASKNSRSSPVAIVYPMKREDFSAKEVTQKSIAETNLNKQESKPSKILQPRIINSNRRQIYSVGNNKTKLPMARNRGQSNVETVEQLVDQASLYGLTGDTLCDDNKENIRKPTARRKSGIPNKKGDNPLRKTTSASNVPSLLPSALPSTATAPTTTKNSNHLVNKESKLRPMKGISQLKIKGLPQSQLRLPASRQSLASQGTPTKSVKARQSGIASLRREPSFTSKTAGTPGLKNTSKDQEEHKPEIPAARNALVTPIQRTPSSRKSIVGRQILARSASNSTINNATMETQSRKRDEDEKTGINDQQVHTPKTEIKEQQVQAPETEIEEQQLQAPKIEIKEQQLQAPETETNDQVQAPNLSHSNIMSRYRKLCEKATKSEVELDKKIPLTASDSCINSESEETKADVRKSAEVLGVLFKESPEKNQTDLPQPCMSEFVVPVSVISDTKRQPEESAPLIEILPEEQKPPSLLHLSPVRCFNQFLDPFHTGETPPPLIDIGDVLEPEKPKELNLIEF